MFGVSFKNPVMGASGTVGYGLELLPYVDIGIYGAIVTKGISLKPKTGNSPPRLLETPCGLLNSIGLENMGAERFFEEILPKLREYDTRLIVNIFGKTTDEYRDVAAFFKGVDDIDALEINLSCPNIEGGEIPFGRDPEIVTRIIEETKGASGKPVIAKLTPNVTEIGTIARAAQEGGADAISLINTVLGMAVDIKGKKPYFENRVAGLSGPAIKPIALRCVWEAARSVTVPIIGIGGITSVDDVIEFIMCGAGAVQIGTAHFVKTNIAEEILAGLKKYLDQEDLKDLHSIRGIIEK
jgi:dihydroorotate dehydrogenase (NAD+) catalytic subunit